MNKIFWKEMVNAWCKLAIAVDTDIIDKIAVMHSRSDTSVSAGYSVNPLDDEFNDEEDDCDV